jgi:hypothetical protein
MLTYCLNEKSLYIVRSAGYNLTPWSKIWRGPQALPSAGAGNPLISFWIEFLRDMVSAPILCRSEYRLINFPIPTPMRQIINPQLQFGEQDISRIEIDPLSRDDIPRILRGLQYIYVTPEVRGEVFSILAEVLPRSGEEGTVNPDPGRPGMEQWKILVLGVLRLGLNADYDRIQELANQHTTIRQMLGHGDWADAHRYALQTLKDNLRLFTPEVLDRINRVVVDAGHDLVKKVRTSRSPCVLIRSWSRPTCISRRIPICCSMRSARSSTPAHSSAMSRG